LVSFENRKKTFYTINVQKKILYPNLQDKILVAI